MAFRSMAVAWSAVGGYGNKTTDDTVDSRSFALDAVTKAVHAVAIINSHRNPGGAAAAAAAAAIDSAAYAATFVNFASASYVAAAAEAFAIADPVLADGAASTYNAFVPDGAADPFFTILSNWADLLENGIQSEKVLSAPLENPFAEGWYEGVAVMRSNDENWRFWTDWYEDRVAGRPLGRSFEVALLSLSKAEWKQPTAEVNALLVERSNVGQMPAVSVFDVIKGKIEGRSYPARLTEQSELAQSIYEELKHQLQKLIKRLAEYEDHPVASDILDDVKRVLGQLGENFDDADANAARLLQQVEMLLAAKERIGAVRGENQHVLPPDLGPQFDLIQRQLKNFLGCYEDLRRINDRAEALGLKVKDIEPARERLAEVLENAKSAPNEVGESAIFSLKEGFSEAEKLAQQINSEADEEKKILLQGYLAVEVQRQIRSHQNFVEVVIVQTQQENAARPGTKQAPKKFWKRLREGVADGIIDGAKDFSKKLCPVA